MAIAPITNPAALPIGGAGTRGAATEGGDFGQSLTALLDSVESNAGEANEAIAAMTDGTGDVHSAMLALHRAEVSMQLTVQVRNKLVQAYQDLMRMPI
ncbi:MAG: flagellar hook-basal body complex protein FliE [Vicinamibacterales bacterium]|jgi:flagellar hook-basal body complex protein FliE